MGIERFSPKIKLQQAFAPKENAPPKAPTNLSKKITKIKPYSLGV
jgi:hypothetical protein